MNHTRNNYNTIYADHISANDRMFRGYDGLRLCAFAFVIHFILSLFDFHMPNRTNDMPRGGR